MEDPSKRQKTPQLVLIDTSVLLVDPEVVVRVIKNRGLPLITNTILSELDSNKKNADETVAKNAKRIFRTFKNETAKELTDRDFRSVAR